MKLLFDSADRYLKLSDWKDLTEIKFCLFSMGVLIGVQIPKRWKQLTEFVAAMVFVLTYIPLMAKYFSILLGMLRKSE